MLSRRGRSASPGDSLSQDSPGVPCIETPKGRKKFSFKEPEIMGFLGFRRMSLMRRPPQLQHLRSKSLQPPPRKPPPTESVARARELEELEVYRGRMQSSREKSATLIALSFEKRPLYCAVCVYVQRTLRCLFCFVFVGLQLWC